jgi:ferredoxin-NADP reductase
MSAIPITLTRRETVARGTESFHFSKPSGFAYKAGQTIDLAIDIDGKEEKHTFSLITAPHEEDIAIATRMRDSDFKRALGKLPVGAALAIEGPFGSFALHNDVKRPAVLIAGGIGITPFLSMLRHQAQSRPERTLTLLYSNRLPEDAAFLAELQSFEKALPAFRLIATMTKADATSSWTGPKGHIDAARLRAVASKSASAIYYVAGPPAMVAALRTLLGEVGVDDDDVRSEDFPGY